VSGSGETDHPGQAEYDAQTVSGQMSPCLPRVTTWRESEWCRSRGEHLLTW
jgi:hypothetical protein